MAVGIFKNSGSDHYRLSGIVLSWRRQKLFRVARNKDGKMKLISYKTDCSSTVKKCDDDELGRSLDCSNNLLDSLPEELLVKIITKLKQSDLKNLVLMSKRVSKATLEARETHFKFTTPSITKPAFGCRLDLNDSDVKETQTSRWSPMQVRLPRPPLHFKRFSKICVALFTSP